MKAYAERHIRRSELFQLILLQHLYARPESNRLVFQGGTAIRWCHGGERFSEDLDFVTHLDRPVLEKLMRSVEAPVARESIAHFGPGRLTVTLRGRRDHGTAWRMVFEPQNARDRITVKVECERLREGATLATEPRVLGMQTAVSYLIGLGEFRIPRPNSVLVVETPEEILSDKVRALLERPYLKGRDIYDVWHLRVRLRVPVVREMVERKFSCYAAPFTPRRLPCWFESADKDLVDSIEEDLHRFLSPEAMGACRDDGYRPFLEALKDLFRELRNIGTVIPS
ncbi:MAG: nucleotidyl transferase AbiEii/AbiGii toxin family protein [Deltaproteobacteria bacterium]|nr:MAG: nucleotidyl transferase AbiEii/AbiGii toxin family protein [Deltaproteobacteria bacterium]